MKSKALKALAILLAAVMFFSITSIETFTASAATEIWTTISSTNKYYFSSINPFYAGGYGLPNCTCYAFGRAYEVFNKRPNLSTGNAGAWYAYNKNNKYYSYGSTPQANSIICWENHVAYVESINNDGSITFTESGWNYRDLGIAATQIHKYTTTTPTTYTSGFQGYIYLGNSQSSHTHSYTEYVYYWSSHPHYKCYKCSCGEVKENRNQTAFEWSAWTQTKAPTCTEKGIETRTCSLCSETETKDIAALGHNYNVSSVTDPTCVCGGYTTYTCSRCGNSYTGNDTAKLSHIESDWIIDTEPGIGIDGSKHKECTTCHTILEVEMIPRLQVWYQINNGTVTITSSSNSLSGELNIPNTIEGYPVTEIDSYAFYGCTGLTSIAIPSSVTSIGRAAFYGCTGLKSIIIPDSVTSIGSSAFGDCTGLTSIDIPDSVTSIGSNAFYGCTGLKSIIIPDSVTSIGSSAFSNCTGLTSIDMPNSVTSIGRDAFSGCTNIQSIFVNNDNPVYQSQGNCLIHTESKTLIFGCKTSIIPNNGSITSIGEGAFGNCTGLTSIIIPDSVTSIDSEAFSDCTGLTSIDIPNSVTSIGRAAFYDCTGLKSIIIPDSVTSIDSWAFSNCTGLTSIDIPGSVTSIGFGPFDYCTGLTSITVDRDNSTYHSSENCLIRTEDQALIAGCNNSIIPNDGSVTSIEAYAFRGRIGLTSIDIPNSITYIGDDAFAGCTALTNITINNLMTSMHFRAFDNTGYYNNENNWEDGILYLGNNIIGIRKTISGDLQIKHGIKTIPYSAFEGCTGLTSIDIPDSVTSIDSYAFSRCSGLTSIDIPDSVTSIGSYAFSDCTGLKSITIPNSITSIDWQTFNGCTSLKSITIPDSVTSIGFGAFMNCTGLTSITIPDSVTSIDGWAFSRCTSLTNITLPENISMIDNGVFSNTGYYNDDNNWENGVLYLGNYLIKAKTYISGAYRIKVGTKVISSYAFEDCVELTDIIIPSSVLNIGNGAFRSMNLEGITVDSGNPNYISKGNCLIEKDSKALICGTKNSVIPNDGSVTSIEEYAFLNCTGLTNITIPDSVISIGHGAFQWCTGLTSIDIPDSVTSIGEDAFYVTPLV